MNNPAQDAPVSDACIAQAFNEIAAAEEVSDRAFKYAVMARARELQQELSAPVPAQDSSVPSQDVSEALTVVDDAANDARHRGDYDRANALVRARVTLYQAARELQQAQPADVWESYKTWPADIRAKLSCHDLRRMSGWAAKSPIADWRIDTSAGGPILVYQNCSVIESEQAQYVLNLIAQDQQAKLQQAQTEPAQCTNCVNEAKVK